MRMLRFVPACFLLLCTQVLHAQVLVVGGTTGGVAAAIQSARSGAPTILVESTNMLGGMLTAAGVSCTDGNHRLYSGMWEELRQALYKHYGTKNLASGWVSETCVEPHVVDSIFKAWAAKEKNLQVLYGWYPDTVSVQGNRIASVSFINKKQELKNITASLVVDATELSDVYAMAGAEFDLGLESAAYSGEAQAPGQAAILQDITWAAVLKDYGSGTNKTIPKPAGYDAAKYNCSTADAPCTDKPYAFNTQKVLDYGRLTTTDPLHAKYMLNWPVHGNDFYLDVVKLKPIQRELAYSDAKNQTFGFIYFLQTTLHMPQIGLADDELDAGMAWIPYNREGRRLRGLVRFNLNHLSNPYQYELYRTGIAVGDYPVDHHHGQYKGEMPAIQFPKVPAFSIPAGALVPEKLNGLLVCEKGISVSNLANGSTRLQPVVLLTGQAAGMAAAQCFKQKTEPRNLNLRALQDELLRIRAYLLPFADILPSETGWKSMQKCGVFGLVKGKGKSEGWENKMYIYPDSTMRLGELDASLGAIFKVKTVQNDYEKMTCNNTAGLINKYNELFVQKSKTFRSLAIEEVKPEDLKTVDKISDLNAPLTRRQVCMMLEKHLLLIGNTACDWQGKIVFQ